MGLYRTLPAEAQEVDVIVAGGGTAGCIVAARLASADKSLRVLIIEGGPDNDANPSVENIGLFFEHLSPLSKGTVFYQSKSSEHLGGRTPVVPAGGMLGGGSSINFCMYSRAQRSDYDGWGMRGWSADDMLPFMKKLEDYQWHGDSSVHGKGGPIQVSSGPHRASKAEDDFATAATKAGWAEVEDLQTMDQINAFTRAPRYVTPDGKRQDVATCYLRPRLSDGEHPNLHVLVESQVVKVVIEHGRATGVTFRPNPGFSASSANAERTISATKMVVVSCGAFGTPAVLERSGVGRPDVLARAGVPLVAENLGVGEGYEDHELMSYAYKTSLQKGDTVNQLVFGTYDREALLQTKDKILGYNGQDISAKLRPTDDEAADLGPAFLESWNKHFKNKPDKPLAGMALINCFPGLPPPGVEYGEYLGVTIFSLYPESRGYVHITGPDLDSALDIDTGLLSDSKGLDVKRHVWAYKKQREMIRRMKCYRGEVPQLAPPFASDSPAAVVSLDGPLADNVSDMEYSAEDDKVLEQYIRDKVDTTWHSLGTCKMGTRESGAAVDERLGVYGVEALKVADLSVAPGNVGANTNNTALAIGERAADLFIRELGLSA